MNHIKFNVDNCKGIFHLNKGSICYKVKLQIKSHKCLQSNTLEFKFIEPYTFNTAGCTDIASKATIINDNIKAIKSMNDDYKKSILYVRHDTLKHYAEFRLKTYQGPISIDDRSLIDLINTIYPYMVHLNDERS